jgi:hypothetical protein
LIRENTKGKPEKHKAKEPRRRPRRKKKDERESAKRQKTTTEKEIDHETTTNKGRIKPITPLNQLALSFIGSLGLFFWDECWGSGQG